MTESSQISHASALTHASAVAAQGTSDEKPRLTITRVDQPDGTYLFKTSDGHTFSIDELLFYVQSKIARYFQNRLQAKNEKLKEQIQEHNKLTDLLSVMQTNRPHGGSKLLPNEVAIWMKGNGLDVPTNQGIDKARWDEIIETLKGKLDSMNSTNQTDTIETESLTKLLDESNEFLANVENILAKAISTIISNLRA
ncbi:MAG: hypothetical protein GDA54_03180 [Alphaproteobacteria bacterium GM7ARS4]|nr:hypothetical protein [Alphaproteobacteria bacterium GM7ARS4]